MTGLNASPLAAVDLVELAGALALAELPADDITEPGRIFLRFRDADGSTVGFGGREIHGRSVLLRSITVAPERRGQGWGRTIVEQLIQQAYEAGATHAYVMTTSARRFFEAQGFVLIERNDVPADILATRQAAGLCPASAVVLTKALAK
jgi:N-acetylglutamate synthase-like GNAT family acetyltransferase